MRRLRQALAGVAARARRRPARTAALSAGVAGVAAVVAIPLSFGAGAATVPGPAVRSFVTGTSQMVSSQPRIVPAPWSGLTMNGRQPSDANTQSGLPWFGVVAGQRVTFTVTVTVPAHVELTKLFLGITISGDDTGIGPHGPIGMAPALATASHLATGRHGFTVHWTVPRDGRGAILGYTVSGAAYWSRGSQGEPYAEEGPMANVFVQRAGN